MCDCNSETSYMHWYSTYLLLLKSKFIQMVKFDTVSVMRNAFWTSPTELSGISWAKYHTKVAHTIPQPVVWSPPLRNLLLGL